MYYLAQVFGRLPDKADKAAYYIQHTLKRQLDGVYDPVEWIKNGIGLASFYKRINNWIYACHCLSACECIITSSYLAKCVTDKDCLHEINAVLNLSWGEFFLDILKSARARKVSKTNVSHHLNYAEQDSRDKCFNNLKFVDRNFILPDVSVNLFVTFQALFILSIYLKSYL